MTHVVAGYPSTGECIELLLGMQAVGVEIIEIQIPFSDPGADGPVIMKANDIALENGMTVKGCFEMIGEARAQGLSLPVYLMSYANKIISFGAEAFCAQTQQYNVNGLIVPDLPYNTADYQSLLAQSNIHGLDLVPVLSPGVSNHRLDGYQLDTHELIYVTSTQGITGKELVIRQELRELTAVIKTKTKGQVALGFGIRTTHDVQQALKIADLAVIGSAVIRRVEQEGVAGALKFLQGCQSVEILVE